MLPKERMERCAAFAMAAASVASTPSATTIPNSSPTRTTLLPGRPWLPRLPEPTSPPSQPHTYIINHIKLSERNHSRKRSIGLPVTNVRGDDDGVLALSGDDALNDGEPDRLPGLVAADAPGAVVPNAQAP